MEYGLIGEHLPHSFSKVIHEKLADYSYELHELRPDEVDGFMRAADFKGINVTIPYKQTVIPYLDEISDQARRIGAVNTIVNREGRLYGYNTDYFGMRDLISHCGASPSGKKVLILGTGGTSRTAAAVVSDLGAAEILKVSRGGRPADTGVNCGRSAAEADASVVQAAGRGGRSAAGTDANVVQAAGRGGRSAAGGEGRLAAGTVSGAAGELSGAAGELSRAAGELSGAAAVITYEEAYEQHADAEFVINCTPCGMFPNVDTSPLDVSRFPKLSGVIDAIYNPLRDKLILDSLRLGIPAEGGLYMLVVQAVYACEMFTGSKIDSAVSKQVFLDILNSKRNIVLVGESRAREELAAQGTGRAREELAARESVRAREVTAERESSRARKVGEVLAQRLGRKLVVAEAADLAALTTENGLVIAALGELTGQNIEDLGKNGVVLYFDRAGGAVCDGVVPSGVSAPECAEMVVELINRLEK